MIRNPDDSIGVPKTCVLALGEESYHDGAI
jgi:hypothetical protein